MSWNHMCKSWCVGRGSVIGTVYRIGLKRLQIFAHQFVSRSSIPSHSRNNFCTSSVCLQQILKDVPTVRGLPLVGTLFSLLSAGGAEQLHKYIDSRHKEMGPIFKECIGPICSVFVSDANVIRKIFANEGQYPKHVLPESWIAYNKLKNNRRGLYFMDGDEWHKCRKQLNQILLKDNFKEETARFEKSGFLETYFEAWYNDSGDRTSIENLEEKLYNLSTTFMVYYLLGASFFQYEHLFTHHIRELALIVRQIFECTVKLSTIPVDVARMLNLKSWRNYIFVVNESVRLSSELLTTMYKCSNGGDGILRAMVDLNLSKDLINRIVVDFMLAAGDTTATATQWLLYLLAKNKSVQNALYEQRQTSCGDRLMKNIIKESMRLYPVAIFITRYMPHDVDIPPYRLRAGDLVSLSMYSCGRNEQYFPNAQKFNPDRWLRINNGSKFLGVNDTNASLPYAKGSRSCIGRKISDAQLSSVINKLVALYELDVDNTVDIKLHLICVPSESIKLRLKKRSCT